MKKIKKFEDLEFEFEETKKLDDILAKVDDVDDKLKPLVENCKEHLAKLYEGREDEAGEHYIYEAAMEYVFGKDIWQTINKLI